MKKKYLPKLSEQQILKKIKNKKLEDLTSIKTVEKYFLKKRGYIIRIPRKNQPVILIVSGGLDSIITWSYLLEVYSLQVYPVFFRRGQRRSLLEEAAVDFFYHYFNEKYPSLCLPVEKLDTPIPPQKIRFPITINSNVAINKKGMWRGIPLYTNLLFSYAVQYATFLEITQSIKVRSIFAGFMESDGKGMKDETLTVIRLVNQFICQATEDSSWQLIPLPIEKGLGFYHDKDVFIKWASQYELPLEKTRSCIMWGKYHCGNCVSCHARKQAFIKAGVTDKTVYAQQENKLFATFRKLL